MITQIQLSKDFFFGGNATFTIKSHKTHDWRTYKIRKPDWSKVYLVSLLSGPDNENSFTYIGKVNSETGELTFTAKSKMNDSTPAVVILRWFLKHLFSDGILMNADVAHAGKCGCCGRTLTVPESIERGIGPECWSRLGMA